MPQELTCRTCGTSFTLDPKIQARYPGWTPSQCRDCHATSSNTGSDRGSGTSRRGRGGAGSTEHVASGVFTDGAAIPNPGPGGWGAVYVIDDEIVAEASGHDPDTTNNRMELRALIEGARLVPEGVATILWSDSNLAVRTVNEWAAGWKARGWKRKRGPVENLDLVRELYELLQARPELEVRWIKAHVGHRWNEYADGLANDQAAGV